MIPLTSTDPSDIANAARCFSCNVTGVNELALRTYLLTQTANIATPPCVTPTAPSQPTLVTATTNLLKIAWTQPANSGSLITSYTISWGTTSGVYTNSATVGGGIRSYTISGLTGGTQYFFVVKANAFAGCSSANSAEGNATTGGTPAIDPAVTAWQARVIANGGASPSQATLNAADTFWKGIKADGLDTLIITLNFFAPDNLTAAITPFILGPGSDPWTNHNFVAGDLGTGGLTCNNNGKWLDTGMQPASVWSTDNDYGHSCYALGNGGNQITSRCATLQAGPKSNGIYCDGTEICWGINGFEEWKVVVGFTVGRYHFTTVTRTAVNAAAMYHANSLEPFSTLGTTAVAPEARSTLNFFFNARNNAGAADLIANDTYSFFCMHHGMTSAQAQALFNRVQTLRTAFGGGFT